MPDLSASSTSLGSSAHSELLEHLSSGDLTPREESRFIGDRRTSVRKALAQNPGLSERSQLTLLSDSAQPVVWSLMRSRSLSPRCQELVLTGGDLVLLLELSASTAVSQGAQSRLALHPQADVRSSLARNDAISLITQHALASDPSSMVREHLATLSSLHPEVQLLLAHDVGAVRRVLGRNLSLSVPALGVLSHDSSLGTSLPCAGPSPLDEPGWDLALLEGFDVSYLHSYHLDLLAAYATAEGLDPEMLVSLAQNWSRSLLELAEASRTL